MLKYCKKQHPLTNFCNSTKNLKDSTYFNSRLGIKSNTKPNESDIGRNKTITNNNYL